VLVGALTRLELPSFEVIVADDGSTDGTREYLTDLAAQDPRFRTLFHDGKQTTLRAQAVAISDARGELVVVMDADLQHPVERLPAMVEAANAGADLVVASRYAPGGSVGPRTLGRWAISRGAEWLAKLRLPEARVTSDPMSGFFLFRRAIYRPLDPSYRGYKLLLFLLVMAGGRRVRDVPYQFQPRREGASKMLQDRSFLRLFLREIRLARALRKSLRAADRRARSQS